MPRELVIVLLVSALLGSTAVAAANRPEASRHPRWMSQAGMGLLCGMGGALVATAPYVDLVPDRYEVLIGSVVVALTVGIVVLVAVRWKTRDRHQTDIDLGPPVHGRSEERPRHARRPRRIAEHRPVPPHPRRDRDRG